MKGENRDGKKKCLESYEAIEVYLGFQYFYIHRIINKVSLLDKLA